jgi:hypothetical protein
MATITSASSGNFSDTATWVGGVVPGVGDDAVAATGHVVAIDVDTTVISVQQAGTGKFTLGDGRTLNANVTINASTIANGGTVEVTATTGQTATINGNISGASSTTNSIAGVVVSGLGKLIVNGDVTATSGNVTVGAAIYTNVACQIEVNCSNLSGGGRSKKGVMADSSSTTCSISVLASGNVTGGANTGFAVQHSGAGGSVSITAAEVAGGLVLGETTGNAIQIAAISTLSITATTVKAGDFAPAVVMTGATTSATITATTVSGGSGVAAIGISATGASSTLAVTASNIQAGIVATGAHGISHTGASGTVTAIGSVFGGGTLNHGILSSATANGVIMEGNMTDSTAGAVAVYTRIFRMSATNSGVTQYANTVGYPTGTLVSRVSPDNVTGMAQIADVRLNTIYGYNNELTGVLAMPQPQSVAYGVPVDNTTGTAEFDLGRVAQIIGLQVAAGATEGTSL